MELLVVLAVIGMIVGMSVPALTRYSAQVRLKSVTRQVVGLISLARSLSIGSRAGHAVVVDADAGEITVVNTASGESLEQKVRIPKSVAVEVEVAGEPSPEAQVSFRPNGSLTGRSVSLVLTDRNKHQTITVTGATGAISVQ